MLNQDLKILIIDDDPIYHLMITKLLRSIGFHNIRNIQDSVEGLNYLLKNKQLPDILLLDINMPTKNGWDLLDSLITSTVNLNDMPIYIVTSSIDKCDIKKLTQYPVLGFLNKPLEPETLKKILVAI